MKYTVDNYTFNSETGKLLVAFATGTVCINDLSFTIPFFEATEGWKRVKGKGHAKHIDCSDFLDIRHDHGADWYTPREREYDNATVKEWHYQFSPDEKYDYDITPEGWSPEEYRDREILKML